MGLLIRADETFAASRRPPCLLETREYAVQQAGHADDDADEQRRGNDGFRHWVVFLCLGGFTGRLVLRL